MKNFLIAILIAIPLQTLAQDNISALIPMPNQIVQGKGEFKITKKTSIYINDSSLEFAAKQLQNSIEKNMNVELKMDAKKNSTIKILIDTTEFGAKKEAYKINIEKKHLKITAASTGSALYAVSTIDQIVMGDILNSKQKQIACIQINDYPRFPFRALMIDVARHFLNVSDMKLFIDQMYRYKLNTLQIHLTDDQGWRIEIKKHPELTQIGARRDKNTNINTPPNNGFYTQNDIKEIIKYAAERNIEVIPEIDIPGHTAAILAAYPELGCSNSMGIKKEIGQTADLMLCAGNPKVYEIYKDIIYEIAQIFPSKKIHLGGDESVIEKNWAKCDKCLQIMKEQKYSNASQLMDYFFSKIFEIVNQNNKQAILWCELNNIYSPADSLLFDYPKNVTLVSWRLGLSQKCVELSEKNGNNIIMAPGEYAYLDYPQMKGDFPEFNNWGMPVTNLERSYQLDPGYGLPEEKQKHILGIMGTLWSEAMQNINRVTYMTYPRALALAEAGWTEMKSRSWESFAKRVFPNVAAIMERGISVRAPFEIVKRNQY